MAQYSLTRDKRLIPVNKDNVSSFIVLESNEKNGDIMYILIRHITHVEMNVKNNTIQLSVNGKKNPIPFKYEDKKDIIDILTKYDEDDSSSDDDDA
jgi:uncharacterized membrane protein